MDPKQPYNAPPPPQYQTQYQTQYQQPTIIAAPLQFSDIPVSVRCTQCQAQIVTRVVYKSGVLTWLICGGLCLFGFWLGCQFIPFCIDGCKDVEHYCPNCNTLLGVHKKI